MDVSPVSGVTAALRWSYERWSATDPNTTVTGQVDAASALAGTAPSLSHQVDTWTPGSVEADWNLWSLRATWTQAAAALASASASGTDTPPAGSPVSPVPVQQFIVSPAAATLASTTPAKLTTAVTKAVAPLLRMTASQVAARLTAGASLSDLAAERKVDHGALVNAVRTGVPDVRDPVLQTYAAARLADTPGPLDLSTIPLPATAGGDRTQVLGLTLDRTAELIGTTPGDLMQRLSRGSSLTDEAALAGIDRDTLLATLVDDLPPQLPGWASREVLAGLIAGDTASTTERAAPPPPGPPPEQRFTFDNEFGTSTFGLRLGATATLLGATPDDLMRYLSRGGSLTDAAQAAGVSQDDLRNAVLTDLPVETPGWADAAELADLIVSDTASVTFPPPSDPGPPDPRQEFFLDNGFGGTTTALSLTATADLLSQTPEYVMRRLSHGVSLNDLADVAGVSHQDLIDAVLSDLPAQTPGWTDALALAEALAADTSSTTNPPPVTSGPQQVFAVDSGGTPRLMALNLDVTASLLNATPEELMGLLSQGNSLDDLAQLVGVSHEEVVDAVLADLPNDLSGWPDPLNLAEEIAASSSSLTASL